MAVAKTTKQRSYFAEQAVPNRFTLDDKVSYIEHKKLDEGTYQRYQDLTSKIKLDASGETTEVDMALGRSRRFLLETLVTGWNLVDVEDDGTEKPIPFSFLKLEKLAPHVISGLVEDIQKKNQILSGDAEDEGKAQS